MTLIDNLTAIKDCKEAIKAALIRKNVDMDGVIFSKYAAKIDELQLESGDTPSTPTPEAVDYIYTNGYLEGGKTNEIINLVPYEIILGGTLGKDDVESEDGKFIIYLTCPIEIPVYTFENYDIIFTVEVPTTYGEPKIERFNSLDKENPYILTELDINPRYSDSNGVVVRNGISYNSYVRKLNNGYMGNEDEVSINTVKYRITIESK
jgi:hypothetical protein